MGAGVAPGRDGRRGRYMRRNDSDYTPWAVLVFDTEANRHETDNGEEQTLRLWTARFVARRPRKTSGPRDERYHGHTGAQLAAVINGLVTADGGMYVYCHNLGYDLHLSALPWHMAALGWQISAVSSMPSYLWMTLVRHRPGCKRDLTAAPGSDERKAACKCPRIQLADTVHTWPMRLAKLGELLGVDKLPMPDQDADDSVWYRYCARDTDVAMEALLQAMEWHDRNKLGRWGITAASTGMNALRHSFSGIRPTLIDDDQGSRLDRAALYGGRRQCWRHGRLTPGRYSEVDIEAAYATAAASFPMPFKRGAWFDGLDISDRRIGSHLIGCIAECEIDTRVPRFPARWNGHVVYPVGRFTTVLASPEIALARDTGCLVSIGRGQWHLLGTGYQRHFTRCLEWGNPAGGAAPPVIAAMWKHIGRATVGKFAQHGYITECTNMLSTETLYYEQSYDMGMDCRETLIHYGGWIWKHREQGDGTYAYPAVTAWVESHVRAAIGRAAEIIGPDAMVLCDTDGLWISAQHIEDGNVGNLPYDLAAMTRDVRVNVVIGHLCDTLAPFTFREKSQSRRMRIAGPQNYQGDMVSRQSGRPSSLRATGDDSWAGQVLPGFGWQQRHSRPGVFRTQDESWQWPANRIMGWCLADGRVAPLRAVPDGASWAISPPWQHGPGAAPADTLADVQHPALAALRDASVTRQGAAGPDVTGGRDSAERHAEHDSCPAGAAAQQALPLPACDLAGD